MPCHCWKKCFKSIMKKTENKTKSDKSTVWICWTDHLEIPQDLKLAKKSPITPLEITRIKVEKVN